jgi:hypothetical protein
MKEAKKYINRHKVKFSGKWYIAKVRANEAVEIAFEEGSLLRKIFPRKRKILVNISNSQD